MDDGIMMSSQHQQSSSSSWAGDGVGVDGSGGASSNAAHYVTSSSKEEENSDSSNLVLSGDVVLTVMSSSGNEQHITVSKDITARKLKQLCIPKYLQEKRLTDFATSGVPGVGACGGSHGGGGISNPVVAGVSDEDDESRFKLIHAKSGKCLVDSKSLAHQNVRHSDCLLLLPRKTKPSQFATLKAANDISSSRPSTIAIEELTTSMPVKNESRNPRKDSNFSNYLAEMRKIILSLVYVSHRLLCYNKEAVDMFREAITLLKANRASEEMMLLMGEQGGSGSGSWGNSRSSYGNDHHMLSTGAGLGEGSTSSGGRGGVTNSSPSGGGSSSISEALRKQQRQNIKDAVVDLHLVKQLVDMGFKPSTSKLALIINDLSVPNALEWLLANNTYDDDDDDLQLSTPTLSPQGEGEEDASSSDQHMSSSQVGTNAQPMSASEFEPMDIDERYNSTTNIDTTRIDQSNEASETEAMYPNDGLKVLKEFHELSHQPDPKALKSLCDMGFDRQEAYDALRINGNHENFACEWLFTTPRKPTIEEWERGIDPNSNMYKAIITNPLVQLLLNNPKTLLALEDILSHPNSMSHYLNDPDAGPLLVQISSIYSTERHSDTLAAASSSSTTN